MIRCSLRSSWAGLKAGLCVSGLALVVAAIFTSMGVLAAGNPSPSGPAEIVVPGARIYPESLTSTSEGRVIIGSIVARTIYSAKPGVAKAEAWIQPDAEKTLGVYGVFADERANTLWACFSSIPGKQEGAQAPAVLKTFDLKTGALKAKYPLPTAGAFCNDIAVDAKGTAYISDTENMEVVRLVKGNSKLEVWAGNGGFGPKGGVLDGISVLGSRLYVNTLETNKVFTVLIGSDGKAGTISEVKLDRAIENPDGMRSFGSDGVLIIEGGGKGRLSRIKFSGDASSGQVTPVKEPYPDGPVAVTVVGTTAYVLEARLGEIFGPAGTPVLDKPFHATAVEVGKP